MNNPTISQIEYKRKLFIVANKARAAARKEQQADKIMMRVKAAMSILQSSNYYRNEKAEYEPTKWSCGCKDYIYRLRTKRGYEGACKHMIAVRMLDMMNSIQYKQLDFFHIVH